MKLTFDYRRNMVLDPMQSSDILTVFPRFKDVKGLVSKVFIIKYLRIFKNALLLSKNKFLQGLYLIMIPFLRLSKTLFCCLEKECQASSWRSGRLRSRKR